MGIRYLDQEAQPVSSGRIRYLDEQPTSQEEVPSIFTSPYYKGLIGNIPSSAAGIAKGAKAVIESPITVPLKVGQKVGKDIARTYKANKSIMRPMSGVRGVAEAGYNAAIAPYINQPIESLKRVAQPILDTSKTLAEPYMHPIKSAYKDPLGTALAYAPLLPEGLNRAGAVAEMVPKIADSAAGRVINSLVKPLKKDFAYGHNAGEGIAREGIIANSFEDLGNKVFQKKSEVGQLIDGVINHPKYEKKIVGDLRTVTNPIDEVIKEASKSPRTNSAVIKRLNDVKLDILDAQESPTGEIVGYSRDFSNMNVPQAVEAKRVTGDLAKWTGNLSDDKIVNSTIQKVYRSLKNKINATAPELKPLNERYANLTTADIAIKYRDKIIQRQNAISVLPKLGLLGGVMTGIATGEPLTGLVAGLGSAALESGLSSTAFKTRLAKGLSKIGSLGKAKKWSQVLK